MEHMEITEEDRRTQQANGLSDEQLIKLKEQENEKSKTKTEEVRKTESHEESKKEEVGDLKTPELESQEQSQEEKSEEHSESQQPSQKETSQEDSQEHAQEHAEKQPSKEEPAKEEPAKPDFSQYGLTEEQIPEAKKALEENQQLKQKIEDLKNQNPFSDDEELAKLYKLGKEDKDERDFLMQLKYGKQDPLEILKNDYKKNHPNRAEDDELVESLIKDKYKDYFYNDNDEDDEEGTRKKRIAKARFEDDAESIRSKHLSKLDEIKVNTLSQDEIENNKKEVKSKIKPIFEDAFSKDIEYPIGEGEEQFKYKLEGSKMKNLADQAVEQVLKSGREINQKTLNMVYSNMVDMEILKELPSILKAYAERKVKEQKANTKKEKDNISDTDKRKAPESGGIQKNIDPQAKRLHELNRMS